MPAGKGSGDYGGVEVLWDDLIVASFIQEKDNCAPVCEKISLDGRIFINVARSCEKALSNC